MLVARVESPDGTRFALLRKDRTDIGSAFCAAVPSSTGRPGRLRASGTTNALANRTDLVAWDLPANAAGFFIVSRDQGFVPMAGGSLGNLCLDGQIGRYVAPGQIGFTGLSGSLRLSVHWTAVPGPFGPRMAVAGETWSFQAWFRDSVWGAAMSNFNEGVAVTLD